MPDIYEDTRQQAGKHMNKERWFAEHGVTVERRKLDAGDYERADGTGNICIDTKRSIQEVAMDCGRDHPRFAREMDRAAAAGKRLVILIEVGYPYTDVDSIARWTSDVCKRCRRCNPRESDHCDRYRSKPMQGRTLLAIMRKMEERHRCRFEVCEPSMSARRICDILGVPYE